MDIQLLYIITRSAANNFYSVLICFLKFPGSTCILILLIPINLFTVSANIFHFPNSIYYLHGHWAKHSSWSAQGLCFFLTQTTTQSNCERKINYLLR